MKAIICGGRDYRLTDSDRDFLNRLRKEHDIREVIEGGANGADYHAGVWADGIPYIKHTRMEADWAMHGRSAGPIRNQAMADYCEPGDLCIAFPGGAGTADMIRRATERGLRVILPSEDRQ